jgi:hypothetical protein
MIKILEGISNIGTEVKCEECSVIVHCEESDWRKIQYYYHSKVHINDAIDCPNCGCLIYRWETI